MHLIIFNKDAAECFLLPVGRGGKRMNLKKLIRGIVPGKPAKKTIKEYYSRFMKNSFTDCECESCEQFQASIIRLYHTIEKGLTYENYRAGFGRGNIDKLITSLEQYNRKGFDCSAFFYETALSCLKAYFDKNREYGLEDTELEERVSRLPGNANDCGGTIEVSAPSDPAAMNYGQIIASRHSIRHFSGKPVDIERLKEALKLAEYTPSACNRQGWRTRIVSDSEKKKGILANQNGNKGFGQEIDKLLVVTADLRAQQQNREIFQAFIDGGMYAENILNSLYYKGIGSVPLSAALTPEQERTIRNILGMDEAEVFILFIGVGNYPAGTVLTTRSERRPIEIQML